MKSIGIVRNIDDLGRIVLPKELRRVLGIDAKNRALEIYVDGENVVLKKYLPACVFCASADDLKEFEGRNLCAKCRADIATL